MELYQFNEANPGVFPEEHVPLLTRLIMESSAPAIDERLVLDELTAIYASFTRRPEQSKTAAQKKKEVRKPPEDSSDGEDVADGTELPGYWWL